MDSSPVAVFLVLVVALLGLHEASASLHQTEPGFRVAVTTKGFDYLTSVGIPLLKNELATLTIPDQSGKADVKIGKIKYELKNIRLADLSIGSSTLTSSPGTGLTLQASDISISVTADWSYKFVLVSDHGSVRASGSGISLTVSILAGANAQGQPNVTTTGCSFNVGHLSVKLSGGASWLYNLFDGVFEKNIKSALNGKMCDLATNSINGAANKALSSIPVVVDIDDVSELSYALIRQPNYTSWFVMTDHKGEFRSVKNPNEDVPFSPSPLPPLPPSSQEECRMVYLWATDYVANTASLVYMNAGYLQYNITPDMVSHMGPFKLDTTTFTLLVPQIYQKYPNKSMSIGMRATKPPLLSIKPEGINITVPAALDFYVIDGEEHPLTFSLGVMASVDATVALVDETNTNHLIVQGNATRLSAELSILHSNVGKIDVKKIQGIFDAISNSFLLKQINKFVHRGFPIPNVDGLEFMQPSVKLGKGYVVIDTDVGYTP